LTYQGVAALWYYYYELGEEVDVHPWNMIVHATVCYGYSGNDGVPHMAKSFVDHGATAFVGATVSIPATYNDDFTSASWTSLCQNDQNVYTATISYINTHNYYCSSSQWTYGNHICIYGDPDACLAN